MLRAQVKELKGAPADQVVRVCPVPPSIAYQKRITDTLGGREEETGCRGDRLGSVFACLSSV